MTYIKYIYKLIYCFLAINIIACSESSDPEEVFINPYPEIFNTEVVKRLTETYETENYIFYFREGDIIEYERMEAYAQWAINYLGITLPKKIEYFKFRDPDEIEEAIGIKIGGIAFSRKTAFATYWSWHNHETYHVLNYIWKNSSNFPPSFFNEGIAAAHEFDPYNNDWEPRNTRYHNNPEQESYLTSIKRFKDEGKLYSIADLLDDEFWWDAQLTQTLEEWITYPQAGIFVYYLIEQYGLDKLKLLLNTLNYQDNFETLNSDFASIIGVSIEQAEQDWLLWLDNQ